MQPLSAWHALSVAKAVVASRCSCICHGCIAAGLTLHADPDIRGQAMSVMKRIMRGLPRLRNAMLLGLAGLAARIPDDTPEVLTLPSLPVTYSLHLKSVAQGMLLFDKKPVSISMLMWCYASSFTFIPTRTFTSHKVITAHAIDCG